MPLSRTQIRHLRGLAHALRPVVMVGGNGLTPGVLAELEQAIAHHELVKVQIGGDDRDARRAAVERLAAHVHADVVQAIGKTVTLFRRNPDAPRVELPR
jgi:RNA-binding protein